MTPGKFDCLVCGARLESSRTETKDEAYYEAVCTCGGTMRWTARKPGDDPPERVTPSGKCTIPQVAPTREYLDLPCTSRFEHNDEEDDCPCAPCMVSRLVNSNPEVLRELRKALDALEP